MDLDDFYHDLITKHRDKCINAQEGSDRALCDAKAWNKSQWEVFEKQGEHDKVDYSSLTKAMEEVIEGVEGRIIPKSIQIWEAKDYSISTSEKINVDLFSSTALKKQIYENLLQKILQIAVH